MKILIVANVVDHGTRSITDSYVRELEPVSTIEISKGLKQLGLRSFWMQGMNVRKFAKDADVVVCLQHGALCIGAFFLPGGKKIRKVAVTDWTRAFPSRRRDIYIRIYNRIYALLTRRFDGVFSPAPGLCDCYSKLTDIKYTLCPLPYPEVSPETWPVHRSDRVSLLYIGANIKRKAGDVLLDMWRKQCPARCRLSFVAPYPPGEAPEGVEFLRNIKSNTPEQRRLLEDHDIFILPTRHDSYGFAALEALNFGQVVVTTRFAGIASLVEEAGGLVGDSPEEAVRLAFDLATNQDELIRRRKLCRAFMMEYPERLKERLRELLGSPSSRVGT